MEPNRRAEDASEQQRAPRRTKPAEAERKAIADAQKIVAIWNAWRARPACPVVLPDDGAAIDLRKAFCQKRLNESGGYREKVVSLDSVRFVRCAVDRLSRCAAADGHDAAAFPNRAIKIVVPFPAGGPSDVLARMIGQRMSEDWGQPVLIENRVGANTIIGAQAVQKASADGYTILMAIDSTLTMNQYLYRSLPYDPLSDFVPITLVAKTMMFMFVNASERHQDGEGFGRKSQGTAR